MGLLGHRLFGVKANSISRKIAIRVKMAAIKQKQVVGTMYIQASGKVD